MPASPGHWTQIARGVSRRVAGLDKASRVTRLREEATVLGLEAHTLRRYLVVLAFLDRVGVSEDDARRLPIGPLEVILRIWARDPSLAARALRLVRAGELTFRRALAIEKRLRSPAGSDAGEPSEPEPAWDQAAWFRGRVAQTLGLRPDDLVETPQLEDPRFDLVQAQRAYTVDETRSVALLDEASRTEVVGGRHITMMARDALIAAALYDDVVVVLGFKRPAAALDDYLRMAQPLLSDRIHVVAADRGPVGFEGDWE